MISKLNFLNNESSFCHVFLLCAEIEPNPSYQHHKIKLCESVCFQIRKTLLLFFLIWHLLLEVTKNGPQVTKMCHTETFLLELIHPCETLYSWWNSIILWGVGKKNQHGKTHPKHLVKFWQDLISFQRSLRLNRLIQAIWFSFFLWRKRRKKEQFFLENMFF